MADFIRFVMSNFDLTFFVIGLVAAAVSLLRHRPLTASRVVEALFSWFLFFTLGIALFYNFVFHVFFGDMAAQFIGWAQSPFQAEVGFASLGFSVVGFMAFRGSFGVRFAAVAGHACFSLGAAGGHVYQMVVNSDFAPGNAGVMFFAGFTFPIIGFVLLWLQHRLTSEPARATGALPTHEPAVNQ